MSKQIMFTRLFFHIISFYIHLSLLSNIYIIRPFKECHFRKLVTLISIFLDAISYEIAMNIKKQGVMKGTVFILSSFTCKVHVRMNLPVCLQEEKHSLWFPVKINITMVGHKLQRMMPFLKWKFMMWNRETSWIKNLNHENVCGKLNMIYVDV